MVDAIMARKKLEQGMHNKNMHLIFIDTPSGHWMYNKCTKELDLVVELEKIAGPTRFEGALYVTITDEFMRDLKIMHRLVGEYRKEEKRDA